MYLHLGVNVHSVTRTQYRLLQTPSCYLLSHLLVQSGIVYLNLPSS
ncbi:unnamed protein product [Schistosoma curassoni]|uniref:Uncharacterized protein n=1 Tax=Schistosoma curassoni TaxID=6186 RepID=A0A183KAG6_9TREM|nr:unnamed protein product [Schistosoma curassoni]